ncbi:unknown [Odoribacter laneus CAG:561]|nr:unknown [Odoribacter laneus CAG:561]
MSAINFYIIKKFKNLNRQIAIEFFESLLFFRKLFNSTSFLIKEIRKDVLLMNLFFRIAIHWYLSFFVLPADKGEQQSDCKYFPPYCLFPEPALFGLPE